METVRVPGHIWAPDGFTDTYVWSQEGCLGTYGHLKVDRLHKGTAIVPGHIWAPG